MIIPVTDLEDASRIIQHGIDEAAAAGKEFVLAPGIYYLERTLIGRLGTRINRCILIGPASPKFESDVPVTLTNNVLIGSGVTELVLQLLD